MTDLSSELVNPLRQARLLLREPGPAGIDRALPFFTRAIQTLTGLCDSGQPVSGEALPVVRQAQREVAAISQLLDRAALLHGALLQGLTDRSRRDSAAAQVEI